MKRSYNNSSIKKKYNKAKRFRKSSTSRYPKSQGVSNSTGLIQGRPYNRVNLGNGFPKTIKFNHRYVEEIYLSSTVGATASYVFSCNGLYDPNITGAGHQPYYFDQMTTVYNHYCVIGSMITVRVAPKSTAEGPLSMSLVIDDNSTQTISAPQQVAEITDSVYDIIPSGCAEARSLTLNWSAKKYFGKNPLANTELQGTIAANPAEQSYYVINMHGLEAVTSSVWCTVTIEYIVIWKELKEVSLS